jgi:beta-glucanase (GH16 family)
MHWIQSVSVLGLILAAGAAGAAPEDAGFALIWEDEFDQPFLNTAKWEFMSGNGDEFGIPGWGNNELQFYTGRPQNLWQQDNSLLITAQRESFQGYQYTSARIRSKDRFAFRYGRVEGRIKLAVGEGLWPAFWMLPEDNVYGGWPLSGEIDIMEASQDATYVSGAIHFGNSWPNNRFNSQGINGSFGDEWHVYAIEWEPDRIRWYLDDELYMIQFQDDWFTGAATGDANAPFDQDFHLLLNMAVGGNFVPNPNPGSPFPKTMAVDWVRVYEQFQAPWGGTPAPITSRIEAEHYDFGYEGQAYSDQTITNEAWDYRVGNGVDVESSSEGGFNVGFVRPGEWIEYTVSVPQTGTYRLDARVASQSTGGSFRLTFNGQDIGAWFTVPATGAWQSWTTVSSEVELAAGEYVMRWENLSGGNTSYNFNWFEGQFLGGGCPADLAEPFGILDLADINAFTLGFVTQDQASDLAEPFGVLDLADINAFVASFTAGCP